GAPPPPAALRRRRSRPGAGPGPACASGPPRGLLPRGGLARQPPAEGGRRLGRPLPHRQPAGQRLDGDADLLDALFRVAVGQHHPPGLDVGALEAHLGVGVAVPVSAVRPRHAPPPPRKACTPATAASAAAARGRRPATAPPARPAPPRTKAARRRTARPSRGG